MDHSGNKLKVKMFGRLSLFYNGQELKLDKSSSTKTMQLLSMLLYFREGISRETLMKNLYGDRELADRSNNLRVTVFKVRKMLLQAGLPEDSFVTMKNDVYKWSSEFETECDVWEFRRLAAEADRAAEAEEREKELDLRRQMCGYYTAEFLQPLSYEEWVVLESIPLKRQYTASLRRFCALLEEEGAYQEIVDHCSLAESIYPFDEWQLLKIDALMALNQHDEAMALYQEFTEQYYEEMGLSPTEEMLRRYQKLRGAMQRQCSTVDEIYSGLVEGEQLPMGGAFVSYPSFIDRFRFLQRISERSGESNYLVVATMQKKSGKPLETASSEDWANQVMHSVLQGCLRRTDTFTKYNASQYLMLLVGINLESIRIVTERIDKTLSREAGGWRLICRHRALPIRHSDDVQEPGWDFLKDE